MYDVFISYSSVNQNLADAVCGRMEHGGLKCWYAPRNIAPGEDWPAAIMNAIHQSRVFVLIYSANSNSSKQVVREVAAAVESECTIVPFRIDETPMCDNLSYYLSGVHWMNAVNSPLEKSLEALYTRIWWMIHPPQVPYQQPQQPVRPIPLQPVQPAARPVAAPPKKKKTWVWILVVAALLLLGVVGLVVTDPFGNGDPVSAGTPQASTPAPQQATVQNIPFQNLSQLGQYQYLFYGTSMFDKYHSAYFLANEETGLLSCVKTDTGFPIMDDIAYDIWDPMMVSVVMADHYNVVYFVDEITGDVEIYDKSAAAWTGWGSLDLTDDEVVMFTLLNGNQFGTAAKSNQEAYFLICDLQSEAETFTRVVKMYPNGQTESRDISRYELTEFIAPINKPNAQAVALIDSRNNVKILDLTALEILNISHESVLRDYLPYHDGHNDTISETGRYISLWDAAAAGVKVSVWDLEQQKQVFSKTFTQNFSAYFAGEDSLVTYNEEDNSVTLYNLQTGRSVQKMDAQYFAESEAFEAFPFAFCYTAKTGTCFFVTTQAVGENGWGAVVTATDLEGNILAQSQVQEIPFSQINVDVFEDSGMFFFVIQSSDCYDDTDNGVASIVYRAKYTYNAQGDLIFIQ